MCVNVYNWAIMQMMVGLLLFALTASSPAEAPPAKHLRVPVWSDEFSGSRLDASKWQAPTLDRQGAQSRWDPALVAVEGGHLRLKVQRRSGDGPRYLCGAVRTRIDYDASRTLFQKRYGYFEIRARLPKHVRSDVWFAFWLMAGDIRDHQTDSQKGSEIDVLETFNLWDNRLNHAVHWGGYGPTHNSFDIPSPRLSDLNDGKFHVYGFLWNEREYTIFRNGVRLATTDAKGLGSKADRPKSSGTCREPGYLKLTLEAAPWAGPTPEWEPNGPAEDDVLIDYIRVYNVKESGR